MSLSTMALWARYNTQVNADLATVLDTAPAGVLDSPLVGYFTRVGAILDHLYGVDLLWLARFSTLRPFAPFRGFRPLLDPPSLTEKHFESVGQFRAERSALDAVIEAFVADLSDADLASTVHYRNTKGEAFDKNFGGALLHFFNHQTHHRGQVSLALDQLGVANDYSGLVRLVGE